LSEVNPKHFRSITDWQNWLNENYEAENVIWILIQKKASKKQGIHYEEAVIEAVAHGWIDGKMKSLNSDEFMQHFAPRRSGSIWSQSNRERALRLISEGRMTPAGFKAVEEAKTNGRWDKAYSSSRSAAEVPSDLILALKRNKLAYDNFEAFPPSARFMYIHWLNDAKRQDTRERRIYTVVERSEKNQRSGIDLRITKNKQP
jgi:uncharacterized protein YdeI (YjbR/CyaY-like superfamily)